MKTFFFFIFLSLKSYAALPPDQQNEVDMDVMMDYARSDREVMAGLKSINLENYTITFEDYGKTCVRNFVRKPNPHPMPGPAPQLIPGKIICE